jgi:hypothetical protein
VGENAGHKDTPLLTLRATIILLLATLLAGVAGVLKYLDHGTVAASALAAGATWAGAVVLLKQLIGP